MDKEIKKKKILIENSDDESIKSDSQAELDDLKSQKENGVRLTWEEAISVLTQDENCKRLYNTFDTNSKQTTESYALAALCRTLGKRPGKGANSPENWGLITTCYPDVDTHIKQCPSEVESLNELITNKELKIEREDWKALIKIFIDYEIRSNQSMFFQHSNYTEDEWKKIDIKTIRSYRTEEGNRKHSVAHYRILAQKGYLT